MRRHKYGAKPTVVDGIRFASQAEAKRYGELKLLEKAGEIQALKLQPRFPLMAPGRGNGGPWDRVYLGDYVADFIYHHAAGATIVEDVKGVRTELYKWKKRHFEAQYGITITEITK